MPKMKHLLRKLHIGGGCNNDNHQPSPPQTAEVTPPSSSSSASLESALTRIGAVESAEAENSVDFNFFEEEFQVQLALAISVSDPDAREDPETAQIKAAKQISLGCVPSETLAESLSLRYWSYNFVNYDEKVMDGFYDIYGFNSNSAMREKIPHLLDLQAISVSDNVDFEVILVNRNVDPALHQLEERVYAVSVEHQVLEQDPIISGLIQMIADLVVDRMGGPVRDADELLKRWSLRSHELRSSLNNIILPLGCLDVGLSRHRALLFKVLADKINLPCMLVKGSYYTGTDEGAVNVIKFDNGSEYIIDLMAAPGTLIPAELPSDLQNSGLDISSAVSPDLEQVAKGVGSDSVEASFSGIQSKGNVEHVDEENQTKRFENDFGKLLPLLSRSHERLSGTGGTATDAQKLKVKDVSKYVISAAKNPDFAQKLHAVLVAKQLELPSTDVNAGRSLLSDTTDEGFVLVNCETNEANQTDDVGVVPVRLIETNSGLPFACSAHNERINPALGNVSDWEIPWEGLQIGERIGIGSYGEVYRAEWNGTEVAVKKFMDQDISGDALAQFKYEVEIMLRLRHPNVVLFMGAVTHPPNLSILTEYLPRGSLYKLLHRPNNQLDEKKRMRMAVDVAKGMNYLHTSHPTIVHRDLKTPNLLVDKNWLVKVCDFGLSRVKHHTFLSSNSTAGTPEWMAPEVLRNEPSNEKSDVYSFGVILWELATLQVPWTGMNSMQVVGAVGFQGRHLDITEEIDPTAAQIIIDCWHPNPQLRPSFGQLITRLRCLPCLRRPAIQNTCTHSIEAIKEECCIDS
ncbi:Serine/threonine-protein kinase EDR1 [Camellia lanceoleosa]|uniref:Serine/threonine-protein kinase EDR1 n=1 Tax=Camellia lanceoleosa TaxID=1840588 RepID=A0ACC0G3H5_9ERIC|nr:Serine/threonine-protein kinase EDR1 [Camellia lanceoleosa]